MFNNTFWKNSLKFGALAGIACLGYSVILDLIGITPISGKLFPSNIFILIASVLAVKSYRRNNQMRRFIFGRVCLYVLW
jgi:hypothetical protein